MSGPHCHRRGVSALRYLKCVCAGNRRASGNKAGTTTSRRRDVRGQTTLGQKRRATTNRAGGSTVERECQRQILLGRLQTSSIRSPLWCPDPRGHIVLLAARLKLFVLCVPSTWREGEICKCPTKTLPIPTHVEAQDVFVTLQTSDCLVPLTPLTPRSFHCENGFILFYP